jgi:guanylate kinase
MRLRLLQWLAMTLEESITTYRMSDETAELVRSTKLLLIAGIVGGGKNTVINQLLKRSDFHEIVSHTTRSPRSNHGVMEADGTDYHFVTLNQAKQLIEERAFVEVKYVHGNVYGTSADELRRAKAQNKTAITDIDIHGVVEYLDIKPDTHAVFLLPPSVETWLVRLERRYGNLDEHRNEIKKRFKTAYEEIKHIKEDERFVIVINDDLDTTVERVSGILDGTVEKSSDYADAVTEHLMSFLETHI